ncbi:ABC transporter substrate-binding protein [Paenibacillus sp. TRM 82003]|nr:ABC transporter substrate-binding protein [Paenibacillus sp. TRM 82003]
MLLLMLAGTISMSVAGCAGGSMSAGGNENVTLKFWTTNKNNYPEAIEEFTKANPKITVEAEYMGNYDEMAEKVLAGIVSDSLPHVVQVGQRHGIPQVADSGKLIPIEDFMTEDEVADVRPAFWQRYTYKDKKWVIPFESSTPVMYYNKTLFEQKGVPVPTTWDELIETGKKVTGDGVWGFNLAGDTPWYFQALTWNRGGEMIREDGSLNINGKEAVETLKSIQDLVHVSKVMPQNQIATSGEDFVAGKVAMLFRSGASLAGLKEQVGDKFEIGIAFLPMIDERWVPLGGNGLGIFKSDKAHEEAAWKLVQFLTTKEKTAEGSMNSGYIPIKASAMELQSFQDHLVADPNFKVAIEQTEFLRGQSINPADALVWSGIVTAIESVHNDPNANPQEILDKLQKEVQEYLDSYE